MLYETLRDDRISIDIFTFFKIDLGLDPIPFDNLTSKFRVETAITADYTGLYLDAEQYALMEKGPDWKLNRLRFTVAHELAPYVKIKKRRPAFDSTGGDVNF